MKKVVQGFTLIELLIVIAIIGVLAASVLVLIDPVEQIARGQDSGRKTAISQIGRALQAYYTQQGAAWPSTTSWSTTLTNSGELKIFPNIPYTGMPALTCSGVAVNNICYNTDSTEAVVFTHLGSKTERNKGSCANTAANTWYVWSSAEGRAGLLCQNGEPVPGATGLLNY